MNASSSASPSLTPHVSKLPSHFTKQAAPGEAQKGNAQLVPVNDGTDTVIVGIVGIEPSGHKLEAMDLKKA
jgi:hypothetical protein